MLAAHDALKADDVIAWDNRLTATQILVERNNVNVDPRRELYQAAQKLWYHDLAA
jgi:hypothetical protein